jgi:hypothetical protein
MQIPSVALNIGADVGKDEVAMACVEGTFATRKVHNQRAALLAFLKDLPDSHPLESAALSRRTPIGDIDVAYSITNLVHRLTVLRA